MYVNYAALRRVMEATPYLIEQGIGGSPHHVLLVIAKHCGAGTDSCWVSLLSIKSGCGLSTATITRALATLRKKGVLKITRRRNNTNLYTMTLPAAPTVTKGADASGDESGSINLIDPNDQNELSNQSNCVIQLINLIDPNDQNDCLSSTGKSTGSSKGTTTLTTNREGGSGHSSGVPTEAKATAAATTLPISSGDRHGSTAKARTRPSDSSDPSVGLSLCERGSTPTPVPPPPSPSAILDTAEGRLASLYLEMLGNPRRHRAAAATTWPTAFRAALVEHTEADLAAIIRWGFADDFWKDKLDRRIGDPVDYFLDVDRLPILTSGWRQATRTKATSSRSTRDADREAKRNAEVKRLQEFVSYYRERGDIKNLARTEAMITEAMAS